MNEWVVTSEWCVGVNECMLRLTSLSPFAQVVKFAYSSGSILDTLDKIKNNQILRYDETKVAINPSSPSPPIIITNFDSIVALRVGVRASCIERHQRRVCSYRLKIHRSPKQRSSSGTSVRKTHTHRCENAHKY